MGGSSIHSRSNHMLGSMSSQSNIRVNVPGADSTGAFGKRPSLYSASQASFKNLPGHGSDAKDEEESDGNSSDDDLFKRNKRVRR